MSGELPRRREPGSWIPADLRKKPGQASSSAEARPRRPQTAEEISARWTTLMDKRGHGDLTPDEEREAQDLEAQMRRMRSSGGMERAA